MMDLSCMKAAVYEYTRLLLDTSKAEKNIACTRHLGVSLTRKPANQ